MQSQPRMASPQIEVDFCKTKNVSNHGETAVPMPAASFFYFQLSNIGVTKCLSHNPQTFLPALISSF